MTPDGRPASDLGSSPNPFLRRHADDLVPWSTWGATRRGDDRPTFLSIGFAACHLCEVMRRESFVDPEIAAILREHFACVLVDREEHPEVDAVYVEALQALTGRAGYPANLFLLPTGDPVYGATYLPPADFRRLLRTALDFISSRRAEAETQGAAVRMRLGYLPNATIDAGDPEATVSDAASTLLADHDDEYGGFGTAPKFPVPGALDFLVRHGLRTAWAAPVSAAETSLDRMGCGAVHDVIGGGFHRYAVDREWQRPHFEKVLSDNVTIASTYLHASQATGRPEYAAVAERTLDFVLRDLRLGDDMLATAIDASAGGIAGATYCWTWRELREVLGGDADVAAELYMLSREGTEPRPLRVSSPASLFGPVAQELRARLLEARSSRRRHALIETVVLGDVGLSVGAFADAAGPLRRADYLAFANMLADRVLAARRVGGLPHLLAGGDLDLPGLLPDYAGMVHGLLALYQASGDRHRLHQTLDLAEAAIELFADADHGGFLLTPSIRPGPLAPSKPFADRPAPSPNALLALALLRLAGLTRDERYELHAERTLQLAPLALLSVASPALIGHMLFAVEVRLAPPAVLALVGRPADAATRRLAAVAVEERDPTVTLAYRDPDSPEPPVALMCDRWSCSAPERDAYALRLSLQARSRSTNATSRK